MILFIPMKKIQRNSDLFDKNTRKLKPRQNTLKQIDFKHVKGNC